MDRTSVSRLFPFLCFAFSFLFTFCPLHFVLTRDLSLLVLLGTRCEFFHPYSARASARGSDHDNPVSHEPSLSSHSRPHSRSRSRSPSNRSSKEHHRHSSHHLSTSPVRHASSSSVTSPPPSSSALSRYSVGSGGYGRETVTPTSSMPARKEFGL